MFTNHPKRESCSNKTKLAARTKCLADQSTGDRLLKKIMQTLYALRRARHHHLAKLPLLLMLFALSACNQVQQMMGIEDNAVKEARQEAEGKAVGGGCRHSGRAIEDCYAIYTWLPKAAIFGGWRDMDAYMRDNKIETIEPLLPPPQQNDNNRKKRPKEDAPSKAKESKESTEKNA